MAEAKSGRAASAQDQRQLMHNLVADQDQAESVNEHGQNDERQTPCHVVGPSLRRDAKHDGATGRLTTNEAPATARSSRRAPRSDRRPQRTPINTSRARKDPKRR